MNKKEQRIIRLCRAELEGFELKEVQIRKNNGEILQGVRIGRTGEKLGLAVYWKDLSCILGEDYPEESAVGYIKEMVRMHLNVRVDYDDVLNWDAAKFLIRKKVVNYERNQNRLEYLVHRNYLDLAEIYYLRVAFEGKGSGTIEVTGALLDFWEISEDELKKQADQNMLQEGYCMRTLQEVLEGYNMPMPSEELWMYIVTNEKKLFGAGIITEPELLKKVLGEADGDYYILPSSVHELLLWPAAQETSVEHLQRLVYEVNRTAVAAVDFLSDHVYLYHADTGTIEFC